MKKKYESPRTASISLYSEASIMVTTSLNISGKETGKMLAPKRTSFDNDEEDAEE